MIFYECRCGKKFAVPEEKAGKRGRCPHCHESFVVHLQREEAEEGIIRAARKRWFLGGGAALALVVGVAAFLYFRAPEEPKHPPTLDGGTSMTVEGRATCTTLKGRLFLVFQLRNDSGASCLDYAVSVLVRDTEDDVIKRHFLIKGIRLAARIGEQQTREIQIDISEHLDVDLKAKKNRLAFDVKAWNTTRP